MLLIVGLDGATLDLVRPWAADGTLPNLASLMREGLWGSLESTVPAATLPGWTTFMTGVNPGRHGIFDFTRRDPGSYRLRFVNSTFRKATTVWRLLSDQGRRVAVLGLPGTYPPEPLNGCMVSGFDTPVTTRADASFVYPQELHEEVERAGGFPFAEFQEFRIDSGWHERAVRSLLGGIERKARLAEALLERESWDCFMLLLGESDTVAHHFWAFHDPASPRFDLQGARRLGDPMREVYAALDGVIGRLREKVPGARILVVSDHGFGGAGDTAVFLNRWLERNGWLCWKGLGGAARVAGRARTMAARTVPESWQARLFRLAGGRLADAVESRARFGGIDWDRTRAVSEELNYFPSVWLNVEGRDAGGTVPSDAYQAVCGELRDALLAWRDPVNGGCAVRRVWHRDELYDGPCVDAAPDLVLDLAMPDGYSYVCLPSRGRSGDPVVRLGGAELRGGKMTGMSGSHRPDGLFVVAGEGVRAGETAGVRIADMAPTILSLCGMAAPAGWDGRVPAGIRKAVGAPHPSVCDGATETAYDDADEVEIAERLERLGYLG